MPDALFTGKLVKRDLARIYASSDVFLFPSITETFGNVVLEAMASGVPPVVAAQGGPKGIVKDGVTGFHAKPKDASDFHRKISRLLDDPKLAARMGTAAAAYAHRQQWDLLCADMFGSYERILGRFAPTAPEKAHEIAV
jgi:glycosyltransferase involved in cell wall biosynthesis